MRNQQGRNCHDAEVSHFCANAPKLRLDTYSILRIVVKSKEMPRMVVAPRKDEAAFVGSRKEIHAPHTIVRSPRPESKTTVPSRISLVVAQTVFELDDGAREARLNGFF